MVKVDNHQCTAQAYSVDFVDVDCVFHVFFYFLCVIHSQLDDVWMSEELKVLNLSFDFPHNIETADLLSVEDFHSNFVSC